jgi:hypothetical protein
MDRTWANTRYRTHLAHDSGEGWIALELTAHVAGQTDRLARVTYWDAEGQFSFEMFVKELPLVILEELVTEAKEAISVR